MTQPRVVAPRLPTPVTPAGGTPRMPDDVVDEQVKRVWLFSGISAFMWLFGLTMDGLVFPATLGVTVPRAALVVDVIAVVVTLSIFLALRFAPMSAHRKADAGLAVMLLNVFVATSIETWVTGLKLDTVGGPSWTAIIILASAMIMPNTPRKTLIASMLAALLGPLCVWFAHLRGMDVPAPAVTLLMFLPNFIWAGVATLPGAMFQRMGRRISEARELGSYELVERLGEGGMGEVWRARHRLLARDAAIKLVRPEVLGSSDSAATAQLRRFEREAQATATLSSQHSIRLFDFGATNDGSFYYVMELLTGRDLESLVKEFGPLPAERAMYLLRQVCHSLGEAHARGLVHRDVKPANIFVCRMGLDYDFVKVLDFGLVQVRRADPSLVETETLLTAQHLIGTPAYMAPEVILGKEDVDRRADVYSLGCVVYFLLTGKRVFDDGTPMQALVDHVHAIPAAPSRKTALPISREIDELVLACLKKDPADRPCDATAILHRITSRHLDKGWSSLHAQAWWRAHLADLTGPLPEAAWPVSIEETAH
jgi:hypothetical protein